MLMLKCHAERSEACRFYILKCHAERSEVSRFYILKCHAERSEASRFYPAGKFRLRYAQNDTV